MSESEISSQSETQQDQQDTSQPKIKLKIMQTKLISDLDKIQKYQSKNHFDFSSKKKFKSKASKNHLKASKKTLKQISQEIKMQSTKYKVKNKVKFSKSNKSPLKTRKPSIDKTVASYDFCNSIKKMAIQLIQATKLEAEEKGQTTSQSKDSLLSGYTQKTFLDGTIFKGICQNGVMIKGQLYFQNGFIYKGQLFLDKFHGHGKLILPKGQIIIGQWNDGRIVGKGQIKYPKGQIYYGDLKNYRRHGKGYLFFNDESKYQGEFTQGQLTGYGVYTSNQNVQTKGYWFYGDYVGQNQQVFQNIINNNSMNQKKKLEKRKDKKYVAVHKQNTNPIQKEKQI